MNTRAWQVANTGPLLEGGSVSPGDVRTVSLGKALRIVKEQEREKYKRQLQERNKSRADYQQEYYRKNRAKILNQQREYREKNKERLKEKRQSLWREGV